MAARPTQYAASLGTTADSGTTYTTKTSVTFTPDASSDYAILWSCLIQNTSNLTSDAKVRLQDTTNTITYNEQNHEMKDLTDWTPAFGVAAFTTGGSPGSTTYAVQFAAETGADVCNIKEARIFVIKLDADDEYVFTAGNSDTTSGTYVDAQTLTFTPPSVGDYLIVMSADQMNSSGAGDIVGATGLENDGSTKRGELVSRTQKDGTNWWGWGTLFRKTSVAASSQSFKIQQRNVSNAGDTMRMRNRCIVAFRLDKLANAYYAETTGRTTSTSTTYQNGASLTQTPVAADHAIFACGVVDGTSATLSNFMKLDKGGTAKTEMNQEAQASGNYINWMHFEQETLAASSTTWTVQAKSETTSTTTGRSQMAIAVLELVIASSGQSVAVTAATETDAAQTILKLKAKAISAATETDAATAITGRHSRSLTASAEVDTAQSMGTVLKRLAIAFAAESNNSITILARKIYAAITITTETDTAQALGRTHTQALTPATETDASQATTANKALALAAATQTDTALDITVFSIPPQLIPVDPAFETDAAIGIGHIKLKTITPATESSAAQAIAHAKALGLIMATQTDTAQAILNNPIRRLVIAATQTDTAMTITVSLGSGPGSPRTSTGWYRIWHRRRINA